ncbi:diacylglycerol kinase [Sphingomonas metalli]|uniref:Diacylglycerol kinase n=1 Tax=Sphingomonas metalli TaxID=1779358 RepID=A0A916SUS5_9SPHN|nr:diacylglycerol kinase family protein [Sphingomonas metalli]GGB18970.1 diacylglycerol kinase [Sphingomonas metalli]
MPPLLPANCLSFVGVEADVGTRLKPAPAFVAPDGLTIGIVCNPRAHRNHGAAYAAGTPGADRVIVTAPRTMEDLAEVLTDFAARGIDLLVIDGGDGTVRDVLTAAGDLWRGAWPAIAVIPSGKTNALAIDLGLPTGWSLADAVAAVANGRLETRRPIEVQAVGEAMPMRGFLLGAGAFVKATALAQHTHRWGAFNTIAVGLALAWAITLTLFGSRRNSWRAGEAMDLRLFASPVERAPLYMLLASTLQRMPAGLKPFGRVREGLKLMAVDAPPRWMSLAVPAILSGSEAAWLEQAGYRRRDVAGFEVAPETGYILDGELFAGGTLTVGQGPLLCFVVP